MIWKKTCTVDDLNKICAGTIHDSLDIRFTEIGPEFLVATMSVDERTRQPFGLLHGGASVVLAESLGSMASHLVLENDADTAMGIEVNANHIKAVRAGTVSGRVTPIQIGRSIHVWQITITDDQGATVCVSRLTVMVRASKARPT